MLYIYKKSKYDNTKYRGIVMDNERVYAVIDMKSFFASVECADRGLDPFKTKLVVADEKRTEGTVCLAVTPYMKKLGVKNRCRLFEIPKTLKFIIAPPRMKRYIEYAAEIYAIYLKYISKNDIHVYSIDESFIDITDYLKLYNTSAKEFIFMLLNEINAKLHIPAAAGIGTNLYLAKIALDITAKHSPDRIGWLTEEKFKDELWNHKPLTDFWGISHGISSRLERYGVYDMEGIAHLNEDLLYKEFGINAELLIDHAWGKESCLMSDIKNYKAKARSVSSSQILPCNYNYDDALIILKEMIESGCLNLAKHHFSTQSLHLNIGYGDEKGNNAKGTLRLHVCTNLYSVIGKSAVELFEKIVDKTRPIRKIGYDFSDLTKDINEFYDLFTDINKVQKEKKLAKAVLQIHDRFGKNSLLRGVSYSENATAKERNKMIGGHKSGEE